MSQLLKKFKNDIFGVLWLALAVFIALSLFSFHPEDPSFNSIGADFQKVHNFCGYFGSFLADILFQSVGICSWLLVVALGHKAFTIFSGKTREKPMAEHVISVLFVLSYASLIALYTESSKIYQDQIYWSGVLGNIITQSLIRVFNPAGVAVILWTSTIVFTLLQFQKPLSFFYKHPQRLWLSIYHDLRDKFTIWWKARKLMQVVSKKRSAQPASHTVRAQDPIAISENKSLFADNQSSESTVEEESYLPPIAQDMQPLKKRKVVMKKKVSRNVENWELPNIKMLEDPPDTAVKVDPAEIKRKTALLEDKLKQFSVNGKVVGVLPGPAVTLFEYKPNVDVKISKITDLADDLSLALSSESVRIIAPIPGRDVVGIETSNTKRETVFLKEIVADEEFWSEEKALPLALGKQANGEPQIVDLRKMPHLMVAGSTGSGKSVFVVSCLTGLLFKHSPKTLRLIVVDPKQVDLAAFHKVPHLLMPPICEARKAVVALKWSVKEMEKRYRSMSRFGARNLEEYNDKIKKLTSEELEEHQQINDDLIEANKQHETYHFQQLPYIVVVIEEFADLMTVDKGNVESLVVRLAQMARASGMHLILAMQSPRKDVVTGLIKTNIPGRISFKVASKMDSRIILDEGGAERLLARGDMLYLAPGVVKPQRHHGPWLSEKEINDIMNFWSAQSEPDYEADALKMMEGSGGSMMSLDPSDMSGDDVDPESDDRYQEILTWIATQKGVSASLLQRRFRLGYPRAARMIEVFEAEGVVGPPNGSKPREVLINKAPNP
ncbi:MAG: DNA translocase FtsK 4TM domain-containing protein [Bdellovibrionales bacterium]|nr:DNA translocase FtsK 4TM domain-containing protein [Bdellovibrionales bacterium]